MGKSAGVENYRQKIKELRALQGKSEKVVKRTISDIRSRVPGWVASEVIKEYGIKKSEVMPATARKGGSKTKPVGTIRTKGDTVDTMQIVYTGRVLTHTHFGMTPKTPKQSYTLKAEVVKGDKKTLGQKKKLTKKQRTVLAKNFTRSGTRHSKKSPWMLMYTGNKEPGGTNYIPFQRDDSKITPKNPKGLVAKKTVSLPQMVSSERTRDAIIKDIEDGLEKRLEHNMKLLER